MKTCHVCKHQAKHYVGGGLWLCFEHYLTALLGRLS